MMLSAFTNFWEISPLIIASAIMPVPINASFVFWSMGGLREMGGLVREGGYTEGGYTSTQVHKYTSTQVDKLEGGKVGRLGGGKVER